jgi:hypothetical protein
MLRINAREVLMRLLPRDKTARGWAVLVWIEVVVLACYGVHWLWEWSWQ